MHAANGAWSEVCHDSIPARPTSHVHDLALTTRAPDLGLGRVGGPRRPVATHELSRRRTAARPEGRSRWLMKL
jgi:hypothetical protein